MILAAAHTRKTVVKGNGPGLADDAGYLTYSLMPQSFFFCFISRHDAMFYFEL
jgi:hypothetical protein